MRVYGIRRGFRIALKGISDQVTKGIRDQVTLEFGHYLKSNGNVKENKF